MRILIRPVVTEKGTQLSEKLNKYLFVVDRKANKIEIKSAVEKMYGVNVEKVATAVRAGKMKQRATKKGVAKGIAGRYKKAYVTLAKGDTINFYEIV